METVTLPETTPGASHVYHQYVIRVKNRDKLQDYLKSYGIVTLIHYPVPIHLQPAYRELGYKVGDLPKTEMVAREILSLPMSPFLGTSEIEYVVNCVRNFFRH